MLTNKILVPVGFSEQSLAALKQACLIAKIKKSEVIILSVIEEQSKISGLLVDNPFEEIRNKVKDKLDEISEMHSSKFSVKVDSLVASGKIYEQIVEVSSMINANLIVMGTNGSPKGVIKKFIGSNAERVVRLSNIPVITIKENTSAENFDNIILPLDLGKETKEKVTFAIEYARYWNSTIRIVSVFLKHNTNEKNILIKNLNQVSNFISNAGVKCTSELIEGEKKQSLGDFVINYEKKFDSDLIIIMTKKEELALSNNLSVTARYIIHNSKIPVMSIKPKPRKFITSPTTAF
ncbi:universal stress protein [Bacteroidota bacterium]|nr:universal stress protein [Bacteroidota bacterium]MDC3115405.1 universal stress protein [Bacteroidota bacterium]